MIYRTLLLAALLCSALTLHAQQNIQEAKFGDVSDEDRALMVVPGDSTADAYVLFDKRETNWDATQDGIKIRAYTHRRVKLLRESSFDRADVELFYQPKYEGISRIKAAIHLPNGETIELKKRDIQREEYDDDTNVYKFTFPGVTEGAIIEYAYTEVSDGFVVPPQYFFQESIPVRWAEYEAMIPGYFNYVSLGNVGNYTLNEVETVNRDFAGKNMAHQHIRWGIANLPAYDEQPYTNNFRDYIPHVRFQLQSIIVPGQAVDPIFTTWPETVKQLEERNDFTRSYNRANCGRAWDVAESKIAGLPTQKEQAERLYNLVAGTVSWDGSYSLFSGQTPNRTLETATGSSGEITHLLIALLRQADIEAHPVFVGLRNSGKPVELYPLMSQFQHVMVLAKLDGEEVLMDPNDINRPMGLPRFRALNHRAFVVDAANPRWIDVEVPPADRVLMAEVALDEEGVGKVDIQSRMRSYYAFFGRNIIDDMEEDTEMPVVRDIVEVFPDAKLVGHVVKDETEVSGPLSMEITMEVPMGEALDDYMYVRPVLVPSLDEELDDVENRLYPVDFGYPWTERYITTITLPEGYAVEELPESMRIVSPDKSITCMFTASETPAGQVSINFTVSMKRTEYAAAEYPIVKQMFAKIIEMQESNIVLKKAK